MRNIALLVPMALCFAGMVLCDRLLHPDWSLLRPYAIGLFFASEFALYVRRHADIRPQAMRIFLPLSWFGMLFITGFPLLVWFQAGFSVAGAMTLTAIPMVLLVGMSIHAMASDWRDLLMYVNFVGIVGLPVAAIFGIARIF